jgi:hypothetical protein
LPLAWGGARVSKAAFVLPSLLASWLSVLNWSCVLHGEALLAVMEHLVWGS